MATVSSANRSFAPHAPPGWRLRRPVELRRDLLIAPLAGAIVIAALASPGDPLRAGLLGLAAMAAGAGVARRVRPQAALLPLMRLAYPLLGPTLGLAGVTALELLTGVPSAGPLDLLAALGASAFLAQPPAGVIGSPAPGRLRAAFIGSERCASRLARAFDAGDPTRYVLVGRVTWPGDAAERLAPAPLPTLGCLEQIRELVVQHDIDVLVLGPEAPRLAVFERVADCCLDLPVRLAELSALYEEVFGHVPIAEINAAWFQCITDPSVRVSAGLLKRAIDLVGATALLVLSLPLMLLLALLITRDGGPWLFEQVRIGEGGRPFRIRKLRTMRVGADAQWAAPDDPRVTRIGARLRRTHLDELPQLVNVIRGEMSLVGPRPEQPALVERLERMLPFYQRRHLIRPGITGWAQVRCDYGGSDVGSAWKLCHDLYYVKNRSVGVDLLILGETLATLPFRRKPVMRGESVAFVLGEQA